MFYLPILMNVLSWLEGKAKFRILALLSVVRLQLPRPPPLLTTSFILYCGSLVPHGTCGHSSLAHASSTRLLPLPPNSCPRPCTGLEVGILAVLSTLGPDPEKRPVQALEKGSGSFGKGIPGSWVPGVWSIKEVMSSRLCVPLAIKGGHGEIRARVSSLKYGFTAGAFLAHIIEWVLGNFFILVRAETPSLLFSRVKFSQSVLFTSLD